MEEMDRERIMQYQREELRLLAFRAYWDWPDGDFPLAQDKREKWTRCVDALMAWFEKNNPLAARVAELEGALVRRQAEPVADTQALEELAKIGVQAYLAEHYKQCGGDVGNSDVSHREVVSKSQLAQTAAILRAAKPYVDVIDDDADDIAMHFGHSELMRIANTRIRYTVAVPQPDPTHEEIEVLARSLRIECWSSDKWEHIPEVWRDKWRDVARAAWAHLRGSK